MSSSPFRIQWFIFVLVFSFMTDYWVTVPVAIAGTYLFVYWNKRRVKPA